MKRKTGVFLSTVLVVMCLLCAICLTNAFAASTYDFHSYVQKNKITSSFTNNTPEEVNGYLLLAIYDDGGKLVLIESIAFNADKNGGTAEKTFATNVIPYEGYLVKTFAWDLSFIPLTGSETVVLKSAPPTIEPSILSLTLDDGYAATSAGPFKVSGFPWPSVTIRSAVNDDPLAGFAWNPETMMIDIASDIPVAQYWIRLTASNGVSPDATALLQVVINPGSGKVTYSAVGNDFGSLPPGYNTNDIPAAVLKVKYDGADEPQFAADKMPALMQTMPGNFIFTNFAAQEWDMFFFEENVEYTYLFKPKSGLAAGTYTETYTWTRVYDHTEQTYSITLTFTVAPN